MSKWTSRKDANHTTIAGAFLKLGAPDVFDTHEVGGGWPDLMVLDPKYLVRMVEIKNEETAYGRRGLNDLQLRLKGRGWPIIEVVNIEDAAVLMKRWDKRRKK